MDLSNENIIHIKKDGIEYIQFKKLLEYSDTITHAYSIGIDKDYRTIGADLQNLTQEKYLANMENYKNLCNSININYQNLTKPTQCHSDGIKAINQKILKNKEDFNLDEYKDIDGLITNKQCIALSTTNADCIPLLFFDPVKKVIANVHSGWKGTFQKISQKAVKKMIDEYGCNPQDIIACMTPSIRKCHFEVDKALADKCQKVFEYTGKIHDIMEQTAKEKWHIDTILINKIILQELGLKPQNIIDSGICSVCNSKQIHSYRIEQEGYGLETAIIQLND